LYIKIELPPQGHADEGRGLMQNSEQFVRKHKQPELDYAALSAHRT
jgi:hypothetical protein